MTNERVTEEIVREILKQNKDYYDGCEQVTIKTRDGSFGLRPDFVITKNNIKLIIECKRNVKLHSSGVEQLHTYIEILPNDVDVFGIAISGNNNVLEIDSFYRKAGTQGVVDLKIKELLSITDYKSFVNKTKSKHVEEKQIHVLARQLHERMRNYGALRSSQKAVFVAAILIALSIKSFRDGYNNYAKEGDLAYEVIDTISKTLNKEKDLPNDKIENVLNSYNFIETEVALNTKTLIEKEEQTPLKFFIDFIYNNLFHVLKTSSIDLLGLFYSEFFSYSTKDGNELGIILTPEHVKNFMLDLVNLLPTDTVLDTCAGTGGFLVAAMDKMTKKANTTSEIIRIKQDGLVGVEIDNLMYSMAFANMKFRGDGKSNLILGSCLERNIIAQYKNKATVSVINPPYSMSKKRGQEKLHELNFALTTLNSLRRHGRFAIIAPVSCFIGKDKLITFYKKQLLEKHTLEAVISMPDQLFYPTNTVTAIGIFTAHVPHPETKKTWFYSLKDDGFEISNKKRLDINNLWSEKKNVLLKSFGNRETAEGKSAYVYVKADDEWVAEAYIKADYSQLTVGGFVKNLVNYYANMYITSNGLIQIPKVKKNANEKTNTSNWKWFKLIELFDFISANSKENPLGNFPLISSSNNNRGQVGKCLDAIEYSCLTVSVRNSGKIFYRDAPFSMTHNIFALKPKFDMSKNVGLFIETLLDLWMTNYCYGRIAAMKRIIEEKIKLPITQEGNPDWDWIENFMENLKNK